MTNRRLFAALLALPLTLGMPTVAHAAGPELEVESLQLSRGSVAVASLNTVPVTVTLKGSAQPSDYDTFYAEFVQVGRSGPELYSMPLKLTKGTLDDGTWQGVVNVPSNRNGRIKLARIFAGEFQRCSNCTLDYPVVVDGPTLAVTGTHIPKITGTAVPAVVPIGKPVTINWKIIDSQTGKPYGTRIRTVPSKDVSCAEGTETTVVLTDTNGALAVKDKSNFGLYCLRIPGQPDHIAGAGIEVRDLPVVAATPSRTSAPVGTVVPVNGTVGYASGCTVHLQRLYGATQWRTVGSALVRTSARFTLNAQPAYKGNIPYRVQFPACKNFVPAVSKTFTIKGL